MPAIVYPAGLPEPSVATLTPTERRALTSLPGPRAQRVRELDFNAQQTIEWALMTRAELAIFRAWWHAELVEGGAWFAATWPLPQGFVVGVRKFLAEPQRTYLGNDLWRVAATCEVRGRGLLPQAPAGGAIGWLNPIDYNFFGEPAFGTAAHANNGTRIDGYSTNPLHAGVVSYAGQTVTWSTASFIGTDAPYLEFPVVHYPPPDYLDTYRNDLVKVGINQSTRGILILTATIAGTAIEVGQRLVAAFTDGASGYPNIAWGPEP